MKCPNCGAECAEGMNFCNECGASLNVVIPDKKTREEEAAELERLQLMQQGAAEIPDDQQKQVISSIAVAAEAQNTSEETQNNNESRDDEQIPQQEAVDHEPEPKEQQSAPPPQNIPEFVPLQPEQEYVPPQNIPQFAPPQPDPEEDKPIKVGGLRITGASVITVFSVVILLCITIISSLKLGLTGEKVEKQITSMNTWAFVSSELDDRLVSDNLFGELHIGTATGYVYDEADFHSFLGKSDILDFIGETAADYVDYIFSGKGKAPSVDVDDITGFIRDNSGNDKNFAIAVDYDVIEDAIEENETLDYFDINNIEKEIGFSVETNRYLISYLTIGILTALLIVLMIWIAVIVDRKARFLLGFYGNIFKWGGVFTFITGLAISGGMTMLYVLTNETKFYLLSAITLPVGIYAMIFGFSFVVIGFIFGKVKNGIKNKEKRSKAVENALAADK